jgi:hypothetical protein
MRANWYNAMKIGQYSSMGTLRYYENWAVLEIPSDLCAYYRSMVPKSYFINMPKYPCHITVVRKEKEQIPDMTAWGEYEGEQVPFQYGNEVEISGEYYSLKAYSPRLEAIRQELGLPSIREGYSEFHITIGNAKDVPSPRVGMNPGQS